MGKFILKGILFFTLITIIDITCGFGFKYLRAHAKGGETEKNFYIAEKCCDDIIILGSSRAARHYNPQVIKDSLELSCYNCGEPGCGIITSYARYKMLTQRHIPKLVIYEVTPGFDYFRTNEYSHDLGRIRQYVYIPDVRKLFCELGDQLEFLRLYSNMYKNNSFILHNIVDNLREGGYESGFEPLYGILKEDGRKQDTGVKSPLDSVKLSLVEKLILETKKDGVSICFMVSPRYLRNEDADELGYQYEPIIELCRQYNVSFYNYSFLEGVSNNRIYFQDLGHLNINGSNNYTKFVCSELKRTPIYLNK